MAEFIQVVTGGTHREMGVDFGRAAVEVIKELVDASGTYYREATGHRIASARRYALANFLPFVRRRYPKYLEEVRGIAEGAGVDFEDMFFLTADEELVDLWSEHCSSAAVRAAKGLFLIHNEDYPPRYLGRMVVVNASPDDAPSFLSLTYPYMLAGPSCGLNAAGMGFAVDSLNYRVRKRGIPTNFVLRDMYAARSLADVRRAMDVPSMLMGNAVTAVSVAEGKAIAIEASLKASVEIAMGESGFLPHTNHVRSEKLDRSGEHPSFNSRVRLAALEHLLGRKATKATPDDLRFILSSSKYGLLRKGRRKSESYTIASAILDPKRRMMYVAKRGTAGHGFRPYHLKNV